MGVRLPAEYQEVEWIECTGGQYLQLGISPSPTDIVESLFAMNNVKPQSTTKNFTLYSAGDGTYQYTTVVQIGATWFYTFGRYFSNVASENKDSFDRLSSKTDYVWLKHRSNGNTKAQSCTDVGNNYQFWIKSPQKSSTLDGDNINLRLFARIGSNANFFVGRAKHFTVTRDNAYVLNLIPCYRKFDSKPGMYDLVTKQFFANAGTGEFLVGPDVIDSISPWLVAWRRIMMAAASRIIKRIATGVSGVVNFVTKVKKPMKVTCEFGPVQEGTGDPSPTNVRPISGWTGCEITHTGGNLLSPDDTGYGNYTIGPTGKHTTGGYARLSSGFIPVSKGDVLTLGTWITLYNNVGFGFAGIAIYDKDKQFVRRESKNSAWSITATIGEGEKYIRAFSQFEPESKSAILTPSVWSRYKIQLERASSRTTYESYTGSTLPITFTDPTTGDPMTVYGGTVTLNEDGSVDLVSDRAIITMNGTGPSSKGLSFTGKGSRKAADEFYTRIYGKTSSNGELFFGNVCSHAPEAPTGEADELGIIYFRTYAPAKQTYHEPRLVFPHSMGINTTEKANAWLIAQAENGTPVKYTYYIANPIRYHFHNVGQLQSFLGENNIWHDMNGQITVEYYNYQ